jgi:hypothetical protein
VVENRLTALEKAKGVSGPSFSISWRQLYASGCCSRHQRHDARRTSLRRNAYVTAYLDGTLDEDAAQLIVVLNDRDTALVLKLALT